MCLEIFSLIHETCCPYSRVYPIHFNYDYVSIIGLCMSLQEVLCMGFVWSTMYLLYMARFWEIDVILNVDEIR